ncbi:hypothetical protein Avbf_06613 [Armadillidium vulgare]|nr:hypothetical protein Avbf_06613 [Armadillidium vulgare]
MLFINVLVVGISAAYGFNMKLEILLSSFELGICENTEAFNKLGDVTSQPQVRSSLLRSV